MSWNIPLSKAGMAGKSALADPRPGDVFQEMYSSWVRVVARDGDEISIQWRVYGLEVEPGLFECSWGTPINISVAEFQRRYEPIQPSMAARRLKDRDQGEVNGGWYAYRLVEGLGYFATIDEAKAAADAGLTRRGWRLL